MHEQEERPGPGTRAFRRVAPWLALLAVVWAVIAAYGSFRAAQVASQQGSAGAGSVSATSSPSSGTTNTTAASSTISGLEAIAVVNLKLRATPSQTGDIVASAKQGATLEVLSKTGGYYRVKDSSGHVGWVPNDTKYIILRQKK